MKRLLPVFIFLLASFNSSAQNWYPLNPGATNYFVNNYGYVRAMRIDSLVAYGNQLHYYPYKRFHFYSDGSYHWWANPENDTIGSWLGGDVTRKADGTFLFPNHWNDTIKIKTLAPVGDTWTFYQGADSLYLHRPGHGAGYYDGIRFGRFCAQDKIVSISERYSSSIRFIRTYRDHT
jgi:hypothetical protein